MIELYVLYILLAVAISMSTIAIYLLLAKQKEFKKIEEKLEESIFEYDKFFRQNLHQIFENFLNQTNQELDIFKQNMNEKLQETKNYQIDITNNLKIINDLQNQNLKLQQEIKKNEAIIHRKSKQIERLKNDT